MDDKNFIMNPDHWPQWPTLTLKRRAKGGLETGFIHSMTLKDALPMPIKIYLGNIFRISAERDEAKRKKMVDESPTVVFQTVDELLAAGWEVD